MLTSERYLDIAPTTQPGHTPTPTRSPTHTPRQCVFPLHTYVPISCFALYCNWKASEGILGNMTTQLGECTQAEDFKMYKFHLFLSFFCDGSSEWGCGGGGGGGTPQPERMGDSRRLT